MGTIIGALATENGKDITLADSYGEHVKSLNQNGARIIGKMNKNIPVNAITPDQISGKYDLVLSITKHSAIEDSLNSIVPFTADNTIIMTLQNGFPEEKAMKIFPEESIMGGSMEFSSTFIEPGVVELASEISTLGLTFGKYQGGIDQNVKDVCSVLEGVGNISVTDNIKGVKWTKITDNSCFSGLPTALGCEVGKVLDDEFALECAMNIGSECARVIQAIGVMPIELFGLLPVPDRLIFNSDSEKKTVRDYWLKVEEPFRKQVASMLQDIKKGRVCEINEINGEVARVGDLVGINTPYNKKVVELVTKLQNGLISLDKAWDNLKEFKTIEKVQPAHV